MAGPDAPPGSAVLAWGPGRAGPELRKVTAGEALAALDGLAEGGFLGLSDRISGDSVRLIRRGPDSWDVEAPGGPLGPGGPGCLPWTAEATGGQARDVARRFFGGRPWTGPLRFRRAGA